MKYLVFFIYDEEIIFHKLMSYIPRQGEYVYLQGGRNYVIDKVIHCPDIKSERTESIRIYLDKIYDYEED